MPNMSYCRFRNTLSDLQECSTVLSQDDEDEAPETREEVDAAVDLVLLCRDIAENVEGMSHIEIRDEIETQYNARVERQRLAREG